MLLLSLFFWLYFGGCCWVGFFFFLDCLLVGVLLEGFLINIFLTLI